jgi:protein-disulfide isomerase
MAGRSSKRKKKQAQRRTRRHLRRLGGWIPVGVVGAGAVAIAVVAIVVGGALRGGSSTGVSIPERTVSAQGRTLGPENARVTIEEYSDFQCPYCARAAETMDPKIEQEYVADGRVKLVFRHHALIGQESIWAAEASECANEQGKFWDYHDKLFENQHGENQGAFSTDNLKRFAQELGLDTQAFNLCLDSRKYEDLVKAETEDALKNGIQSTPTFVVGEQTVPGLPSYDSLKKVIEGELRKNP